MKPCQIVIRIKVIYNGAKQEVKKIFESPQPKPRRFSCTGMRKDENGKFVFINQKWIDKE